MDTLREIKYYFKGGKLYEEKTDTRQLCLTGEALSQLGDMGQILIPSPTEDAEYMATGRHGMTPICFLISNIKKIKFNTYWKPYVGTIFGNIEQWPAMTPYWRSDAGTVKIDIDWTPPSYMKLWFISEWHDGRWNACHLIAKIEDELFRPPVPNVYNNGSICMGSHFSIDDGVKMFEGHKQCLKDFETSEFNHDLIEGQCRYILAKVTDLNEEKSIIIHPQKEDYITLLRIVSLSKLNFMKGVR